MNIQDLRRVAIGLALALSAAACGATAKHPTPRPTATPSSGDINPAAFQLNSDPGVYFETLSQPTAATVTALEGDGATEIDPSSIPGASLIDCIVTSSGFIVMVDSDTDSQAVSDAGQLCTAGQAVPKVTLAP